MATTMQDRLQERKSNQETKTAFHGIIKQLKEYKTSADTARPTRPWQEHASALTCT